MKGLREYKFLLLSGLALVVFAFLVFASHPERTRKRRNILIWRIFSRKVSSMRSILKSARKIGRIWWKILWKKLITPWM